MNKCRTLRVAGRAMLVRVIKSQQRASWQPSSSSHSMRRRRISIDQPRLWSGSGGTFPISRPSPRSVTWLFLFLSAYLTWIRRYRRIWRFRMLVSATTTIVNGMSHLASSVLWHSRQSRIRQKCTKMMLSLLNRALQRTFRTQQYSITTVSEGQSQRAFAR